MNKEETFLNIISKTLSNSSFLGDDCAFLEEYNLAISADTLVEDVHFKLSTISPCDLGKKALLVNISDILASGAGPEYVTVSLSGKLDENFIENFYKGLNETCIEYGLKVIGGDLTGGDKISISITIFGNTKDKNISSRKNAKPGYIVLLAGEHGASATGFKILENPECFSDLENETKEYFIKTHLQPALYPKISEIISKNCKYPYAMMDTSDGLLDALKKISEASNVGFKINYDKIPKKSVIHKGAPIPDFNTVLFGGEDYGLLICMDERDFLSVKNGVLNEGAVEIGQITADRKILINDKEISGDLRFEHFE